MPIIVSVALERIRTLVGEGEQPITFHLVETMWNRNVSYREARRLKEGEQGLGIQVP